MMAQTQRGIALAGGGPLGAIYEIGALIALGEALPGFDPTQCGIYVGVSSGGFLAAGLANGLSPRAMHAAFIESDLADDPFEPALLMRPALSQYADRLAAIPRLAAKAARQMLESAGGPGVLEPVGRLAAALPLGVFDNEGIGEYLAHLLSQPGRSNDFRQLRRQLYLVATDLESGEAVAFGARGFDDVPISRAVQASAALPGLFPPVRIGDRDYVDGVLTKTLHASVALRAGARLLLCVNPLVPFNARLAAARLHRQPPSVMAGGLPAILSQTFRTLIHSRMRAGMERYAREYPRADIILFEPERDDVEMFFTNVFSYADRRRLCEHAYQRTRAQLRQRERELRGPLERHGVDIDLRVLGDEKRTLLGLAHHKARRRAEGLASAAARLARTLDHLEGLVAPLDRAGGRAPRGREEGAHG